MDLGMLLLVGLFAHVVGDYVLQTTWMAQLKRDRFAVAAAHGAAYTVPFVALVAVAHAPHAAAAAALAVIGGTHAVLDHYRVARVLVWARNQVAPAAFRYRLGDADDAGFAPGTPAHLGAWLTTIVDNTVHVAINSAALWWLLAWR